MAAAADLGRNLVRGISSVRVIDANTIEFEDSESGNTYWLVRTSGTIDDGVFDFVTAGPDGILGTGDDVTTASDFEVIDRNGEYFSLNLLNDEVDPVTGFPERERVGGFGYETASMPGTGAPTFSGESILYVIDEDADPLVDPFYNVLTGFFDLEVDFDSGTFSGDAFAGTGIVNLDDIGGENDSITVTIGMSGDISGNKFTGTVTGDSVLAVVNGTTPVGGTLTLTDTSLDGQFFGVDADRVNATWGAGYVLSGGGESITGQAVGFFEGPEDP